MLPLLGAWTVASTGWDATRAALLLRVLALAASGGARRLRWGAARGAPVAALAAADLVRQHACTRTAPCLSSCRTAVCCHP